MRIAMALSLGPLALAGTASLAADAPPVGAQQDARVCRQLTNTGTRISSRECHLKSEWADIDAARRRDYEALNRSLNGGAAAERPISNSPIPH